MENSRLQQLEKRLRQLQEKCIPLHADNSNRKLSPSAWRLLTDLICGLGVGVFIGYKLDTACGSRPWFLFLLTVLGTAAGFYNFYKYDLQ